LYGAVARNRKDDAHPWGLNDDETSAAFIDRLTRIWGEPSDFAVRLWAPSMSGDERFKEWIAKHCRQSVSRRDVSPLIRAFDAYDLVDVFPAVRVPTLVVHRSGDGLVPVSQGRRVAEEIPDARFVELAGNDHYPFVGDAEAILAEVEDFLVGSTGPSSRRRQLLTVAFTDIADATSTVARLGDDAWRELLAAHDQMVRAHLDRFGGEEVKQTGDGFLAVFDGPARAIRCALGVVDAAERLGLSVRIGLHTGECERVDADVRGVAVHVASRIADLAQPGQIMVSSTVRDLVAGSGVRFGETCDAELEGLAGTRSVVPVLRRGATPDAVRRLAIEQANLLRRDGEYWTVSYDGMVATLRDTKGVRDIARLLACPGREVHVLDLAAEAVAAVGAVSTQDAVQSGVGVTYRSGEGIIDNRAKEAYKQRLADLRQEIDDADDRGDGERSAKAREELDALVDELGSAYGAGGRTRRTPDHVERARKAVARRIHDAMARIDRAHPALGRHLNASLRTGVFCTYAPERDLSWVVETN
jgi:class 3 adenylate cyclase